MSLLVLLVTVLSGPPATAGSHAPPAADAAAIREWNTIATDTISTNLGATRPSGQVVIWHGFVSAAVYNAVVGIRGDYAPYKWRVRGPSTASPEAAAVAAAHRVLVTYFPASQAPLDAAYAESLARIPEGSAKTRGVAFGERAAEHLIDLREGDGRGAPVQFTAPPAPGVWRPTPPGHQPFIDPWLSKLRPMLLASPDQFRPGAPPALSSARYARDVNEVRIMGAKTGSARTAFQTETALFFGGNLAVQVQAALRDYTARHHLGIAETARLFAAANTSGTDAVVAAWDAKLHYGLWRPITAIQLADTDGNPATSADPQWEPLLVTPPHPDYISGHAAVAGAVTQALSGLLGTTRLDLTFFSEATGTTRHYEYADRINEDMIDARVWAGIHFRSADVAGCQAGSRVGAWAVTHYFRPLRSSYDQASPAVRSTCPRAGMR
ncbi:vanadium-dependent haloperoxidase [Streptomyces spinoverrucosus]|uniref:vanadium-dependent haloperoxidase n=1 Tax=Streptomyces spinoverrucosus TaxID=284043 RepID=UPI001E285C96|nr:vanadium-dependent haloperoxidase [Streptomyces spinoverrucosus]